MIVRGSGALLVTGGGRGIGRATAIAAAEAGFSVAVNYPHDQKAAEETANVIREREAAPAFSRLTCAIHPRSTKWFVAWKRISGTLKD